MTNLTRSDLYERVWSTPMSTLAREFGLSDRGLAKICERHNIPRPPRGYWAKLEAGQAPPKSPLPPDKGQGSRSVRIDLPSPDPRTEKLMADIRAYKERRDGVAESPGPSSMPPSAGTVPHPKLARLARHLETRRPDMTEAGERAGPAAYGVRVSSTMAERSIRLLTQIFETCERLGLKIEVSKEGMKASDASNTLSFTLIEKTHQFAHELTGAEKAEKARMEKRQAARAPRNPWTDPDDTYQYSPFPRFDAIFSGQLGFTIDSYITGLRHSWNDGKRQQLEDFVVDIAEGLEAQLFATRQQREEREHQRQRFREMEQRRRLFRERQAREIRRVEYLDGLLGVKGQLEKIDAFLERLGEPEDPASPAAEFSIWLRARRTILERRLSWLSVEQELEGAGLFPMPDPLWDPLGDPK